MAGTTVGWAGGGGSTEAGSSTTRPSIRIRDMCLKPTMTSRAKMPATTGTTAAILRAITHTSAHATAPGSRSPRNRAATTMAVATAGATSTTKVGLTRTRARSRDLRTITVQVTTTDHLMNMARTTGPMTTVRRTKVLRPGKAQEAERR